MRETSIVVIEVLASNQRLGGNAHDHHEGPDTEYEPREPTGIGTLLQFDPVPHPQHHGGFLDKVVEGTGQHCASVETGAEDGEGFLESQRHDGHHQRRPEQHPDGYPDVGDRVLLL